MLDAHDGMVNKEILFMVYGHKYNLVDGTGLEGWTIEFIETAQE